jgi:acetolactate synthase-1/2/3 large subunit
MKLSDYVAAFLVDQGLQHAFVVSGGASLHLIHGIANAQGIDYICCHHEQAAAMAADAYSRVTNNLGVAIATSGPGATNMITGICGSYYDSVPVLYITGQVSTFRMAGKTGVRQIGFQETPIVEMCKPITKYAAQINDATRIRYELEKAVYLAKSGRTGPVLIDIPDNLQRAEIDVFSLETFCPEGDVNTDPSNLREQAETILERLRHSQRPIVIGGWGLHLANCEESFKELVERLGLPVALTWGAADILPFDHPLRVGTFGTHGTRCGNFAVQNADFVLSLGSRLDTKATGSPPDTFARDAWKAVVDIDESELRKFSQFGLRIDCPVHADVRQVITRLLSCCKRSVDYSEWLTKIGHWRKKYPVIDVDRPALASVNPYVFIESLSEHLPEPAYILIDTGSAIAWTMQAFKPKSQHRLWHDFNNTAMGWAVPAAIAAALAAPQMAVYCIVGDGSLMMNLQELATIAKHRLNVKIICFDNRGYAMIRQTQDQWLDGHYVASSEEGGLGFPDLAEVAKAFCFDVVSLNDLSEIHDVFAAMTQSQKPFFCDVKIDPLCRVVPQVKFGRPNEDPEPLLPREEFLHEMIIEPLDISLTA